MNTVLATIRNKKRQVPFLMWYFHVNLVSWAGLAENVVRTVTGCLWMPCWSMSVLAWAMKREFSAARKCYRDEVLRDPLAQDGYRDYHDGVEYSECPWSEGTDGEFAWHQGWGVANRQQNDIERGIR